MSYSCRKSTHIRGLPNSEVVTPAQLCVSCKNRRCFKERRNHVFVKNNLILFQLYTNIAW